MSTHNKVRQGDAETSSSPIAAAEIPETSASHRDYGVSHQIIWDFVAISNHLEDIRRFWAKLFGISGSQWLILMAISDLDKGNGVSVGDVSAKIQAVSTFVTTQTKLLEKLGLVNRVPSTTDARVVLMSLSDRARQEISELSTRWETLHNFMFRDFDADSLRDVKYKLEILKKRTKAAVQRVSDDD
jgi:DNA-binding MarR family transcriptional regulator